MGIFDKKQERELRSKLERERVEKFLLNLQNKLDAVDPVQAKEDLKTLVTALVGFFGQENPKLFEPGQSENYYVKQFFTTIVKVGTGAMIPGSDLQDKVKDFMNLLPVIQRYATTEQ